MLVKIENDLFDIASRIRSIDNNYQIYFNRGTACFEVHNSSCRPTKQFDCPFDRLDARLLEYTRNTRIERLDDILDEIEKANANVEKSSLQAKEQKLQNIIENTMSKFC